MILGKRGSVKRDDTDNESTRTHQIHTTWEASTQSVSSPPDEGNTTRTMTAANNLLRLLTAAIIQEYRQAHKVHDLQRQILITYALDLGSQRSVDCRD